MPICSQDKVTAAQALTLCADASSVKRLRESGVAPPRPWSWRRDLPAWGPAPGTDRWTGSSKQVRRRSGAGCTRWRRP